MLNKKILVKSITNLSEARYCAGMFIDYITFDFNPESEYYLSKKEFEEIRGWISGIKILGTLNTEDSNAIKETIREYKLDGFLFSQNQYSLLTLVDTEIKIQEWCLEDINFLPTGLDSEITLLLISNNKPIVNTVFSSDNEILLGFDFQNVRVDSEDLNGYAFMSSFEKQVGLNPSGELMEALEYIEENY